MMFGLLLAAAALVGVGGPNADRSSAVEAPPGEASLFVAPGGSDGSRCTRGAPCKSLDRAYALARPGQTVDVARGTYADQTILWRRGRDSAPQVVFRPSGKVTIQGNLNVYASGVRIAGQATGSVTAWRSRTYSIVVTGDIAVLGDSAAQHPHNVTLEGIDGGSLGTYTAENVVVRDVDAGPVLLSAPCRRAESKIGPNVDAGLFTPRNITWERVVVHGMDRDQSAAQADCHYGGLFIVSAQALTIRESVFTENIVYNIQIQNYVGTPATDVTIQNSWFGCPVLGSYEAPVKTCNRQSSIQFNAASRFEDWLVRYNSFSGSEAAIGDNFRASFTNVRFIGNAGRKPLPDICGRDGVSFSRNAWIDGTCGSSDRRIADPFVTTTPGREDLHLVPRSPASGLVVGVGADYDLLVDIDGRMRPLRRGRDAGSAQLESAEIARWSGIGGVRIGVRRGRVLETHGRPQRSIVRGATRLDRYRRHGGSFWVRYVGDRAVEVGTSSSYYSTRAGLGPGSRLLSASRSLRAPWDECRRVYRRAIGNRVVYLRPDKARRSLAAVVILARRAEPSCPSS